jgi:hypothetical protein
LTFRLIDNHFREKIAQVRECDLTRHMVKEHEGRIEDSSWVGKGSQFTVMLAKDRLQNVGA